MNTTLSDLNENEQREAQDILAAIQNLEELGGPDLASYIRILTAVLSDIASRLATAALVAAEAR